MSLLQGLPCFGTTKHLENVEWGHCIFSLLWTQNWIVVAQANIRLAKKPASYVVSSGRRPLTQI